MANIDVTHYWKSGSPPQPRIGDYLEIHISVLVDPLKGHVMKTSPRFTYQEPPQLIFQACEDYVRKFLSSYSFTRLELRQVVNEINFFIQEKFSSFDDDDDDDSGGGGDVNIATVTKSSESLPQEFGLFIRIGTEEQLREKIKEKGCGVCRKEYGGGCYDIAWMPCVHAFHKICIATWLRTDVLCPLCRVPLLKSVAGKSEEKAKDEDLPS